MWNEEIPDSCDFKIALKFESQMVTALFLQYLIFNFCRVNLNSLMKLKICNIILLPLLCPPLLLLASMLADDDVIDVIFDCDVLVGDFCSILIIVGVPAENEVVASRLFDVVTSETWHGSRLIWRSVVVSPTLLPLLFTRPDEFHVIGNVRLHPVPSNFVVDSVVDLLWCCWWRFNIHSLMFLLLFDDLDVPRLPVLVLVGVFEDDDDEVELPELIFSDLITGVVVKLVTGKWIWSGSISEVAAVVVAVSHLPISVGFFIVCADGVEVTVVVQLRKSVAAAVCDCTKILLFAYLNMTEKREKQKKVDF